KSCHLSPPGSAGSLSIHAASCTHTLTGSGCCSSALNHAFCVAPRRDVDVTRYRVSVTMNRTRPTTNEWYSPFESGRVRYGKTCSAADRFPAVHAPGAELFPPPASWSDFTYTVAVSRSRSCSAAEYPRTCSRSARCDACDDEVLSA